MRMGLAIAGSLAVAACGEQAAVEAPEAEAPCSQRGMHEGTLSSECVGQIIGQVIGDEKSFFMINLDNDMNMFLQGVALPGNGVQFEVPGPQYTQILATSAEAIIAMGFVPDVPSGMFVLTVAGSEPRGENPEALAMEIAEALGFAQGAAITYEVDEMFVPD